MVYRNACDKLGLHCYRYVHEIREVYFHFQIIVRDNNREYWTTLGIDVCDMCIGLENANKPKYMDVKLI